MAKRTATSRLDQPRHRRGDSYGVPYTPTEDEIAAGCLAIRSDWDEAMYRKRAGIEPQSPTGVQTVHVGPAARVAYNLGGIG